MPLFEPIELDVCRIRLWRREDKPSLVRFGNNRKIWRNLTDLFPSPYTEVDAEGWLAFVQTQVPCTHFAIEVEGLAVGGIGFIPQSGVFARTAEFGYWLGEPYWGRGIATAAARALADFAFARFPLARLEAGVFEWNPASMRVLEKIGFEREGVLRHSVLKEGHLVDRVMYAMTREQRKG